jgi:hypothetical protein
VWVEQAIFTSIMREGRGGYHIVCRSRGIDDQDAQAISRWAPSHGALLLDPHNRLSVNFHSLPSGRYALSRSCEGPPEYSGRGGRQVYTHALIIEDRHLQAVRGHPFVIYRNALALGCLFYQTVPPRSLDPIQVPEFQIHRDHTAWMQFAAELDLPRLDPLRDRLLAGRVVRFGYAGDRILLAECLIGTVPIDVVRRTSFATSLQPSSVRPFTLSLVDEHSAGGSR